MIIILCGPLNLSLPLCISPQYSSHRFRFIFSHSIFSLIFMVFQTKTNAIVQLFLIWFLRFLCSWDCLKIFNLQVWTHMPMSCWVVLLFTFNKQLLEVDLNICHTWTLIYHETSQRDSTENMICYRRLSLSVVVMDRLMFSGLWVEQTVVTLSVNGTRRESLPAEGHQCLSTWVWPFGGPGQGRHASNSWVRMMGVRPQQTSKPRQASDSWMTLNLKFRQLSSSLVVKHIFHKL